eukprot:TRINITY_DN25810_c0_g1_i1.p1 TRINITY_DN25810_c0_g1~~TRINITY_DN25810_c0_g1_i1.p1  ORF type:complete len:320 (-),score=120.96 TRINITY_DN25810_c0_g1_i1:35-961(-)
MAQEANKEIDALAEAEKRLQDLEAAKSGDETITKRAFQLGLVLMPKQIDAALWRGVATEAIGMMFFLFLTITLIAYNATRLANGYDQGGIKELTIAFVFGFSIFVLVYITSGISGGNLNPAVTFALVLGKRMSALQGVLYIIAQCFGATLGTIFARNVAGESGFNLVSGGVNIISTGVTDAQTFFGEFLCTMLLCLAVLVGLSGDLWTLMYPTKMDFNLPFVVGMTVFISHIVMIPIDGCSINPARSWGPALVTGNWDNMAIFWFGPLIGGAGAILLWELVMRPPQTLPKAESDKHRFNVKALVEPRF